MTPESIQLVLPWPPSTNTYWRHVGNRTLLSKAGRAYKTAVRAAVLEQIGATQPMCGPLALRAELYPPDRRRRDIDNHAGKGLLDALTDAGVWGDDSQIVELHALMQGSSKPGYVQVTIQCRGEI